MPIAMMVPILAVTDTSCKYNTRVHIALEKTHSDSKVLENVNGMQNAAMSRSATARLMM